MTNLTKPHPIKEQLAGRSIYLVGMMGSGKTSTGHPLAQKLGYSFVDTDQVIEKVSNLSIKEIFAKEGEKGFREIESKVLTEIGQHHSLVVATGGGVVESIPNWGVMHNGVVIWLDLKISKLEARLKLDKGKRPLIEGTKLKKSLEKLMQKRHSLYSEADLHVLINNETPEEVAKLILNKIPLLINQTTCPTSPQTTAN